jgi:prophage DNA circulation protein
MMTAVADLIQSAANLTKSVMKKIESVMDEVTKFTNKVTSVTDFLKNKAFLHKTESNQQTPAPKNGWHNFCKRTFRVEQWVLHGPRVLPMSYLPSIRLASHLCAMHVQPRAGE